MVFNRSCGERLGVNFMDFGTNVEEIAAQIIEEIIFQESVLDG